MKNDEYEEFEKKYHEAESYKQYRSVLQKLPFLNTKFNMDVLSSFDTNTFARIDNAIYQEIENFPKRDYNNSIAYEMLIRTHEYKKLAYDNCLTSDEKIKAYDRLGVDLQEVHSFIFKKSNFFSNQQNIAKNTFDSYCDLTIGDVTEGINKLINFYIQRNQIYTFIKHEKNTVGLIVNVQYNVCHNITFEDIYASMSTYYIPVKAPITYNAMYEDNMSKIDESIPLVYLENAFLACIEQDIPNNIKTKVTFNSTRPLLRFKESPIVHIPINLNLSKEAIVELISRLKDEFDTEHVKSSINYLYNKNFKAQNWKKNASFKVTNKSIAQAFFIYDLYNDIDAAFQTKINQLKEARENKIAEIEADTTKQIAKENQKLSILLEKRASAHKKDVDKIIQKDKRNTKKIKIGLEKKRDLEIKRIKKQYKQDTIPYDTEWVLGNLVEKHNISPYMCKQYLQFMRQYIKNLQYKELIIGIEATA